MTGKLTLAAGGNSGVATGSATSAASKSTTSVNTSTSSIQKLGIKISIPSTWKVSDVETPNWIAGFLSLPGILVSPLNDGNTSMYVTALPVSINLSTFVDWGYPKSKEFFSWN